MGYEVRIAPGATRAIEKLPARVQDAVLDKLAELSTDPRPDGLRKLRGLPRGYEVYRVAVQRAYRIIYQAKDEETWILVVKVADRTDVYKRVDALRRLLRQQAFVSDSVPTPCQRATSYGGRHGGTAPGCAADGCPAYCTDRQGIYRDKGENLNTGECPWRHLQLVFSLYDHPTRSGSVRTG